MEAFGLRIEAAAASIRLGTRSNQHAIRRAVDGQRLLRIYRNAYAPVAAVAGLGGWELADTVLALRIAAVSLVRGPSAPLSHSSALIAHGVEPLADDHREIHLLAPRGSARADELPHVTLGGDLLSPGIPIISHQTDSLPRSLSFPLSDIASVETRLAAAQCAADLRPDRAVQSVSAALRLLSRFDRFSLADSREREEYERRRILDAIEERRSGRGRSRARVVLAAADAACESVQERRLLWILKAMGFRNVRTQVEHSIAGRRLFVDFEIDRGRVRLVIEFDGKAKYGDSPGRILSSLTERDQREKLLVAEGLTVLRFESFELEDPERVAREVATALRMTAPPHPQRALLPL